MSCLERFSIAVYAGMAGKRCRLKAALLDLTNQDISELPDKECREKSFSCCTRARTGTRAPPDRPIGRASYEGETATGLCAHTRARGDYIRELDFSKCVSLYLLQGPELRASPLASPWRLHCPPTYQRSGRVCAKLRIHALRLGRITAMHTLKSAAMGPMQWIANPALAKEARDPDEG